ncbi:Delta-like protein D [Echinococcus granulosus]|nr:Delta-like protein D [Echinococcus granulosus]
MLAMAIKTRLAYYVFLTLFCTLVAGGGIFEIRVERFQLDENFPAAKCCPQDDDEDADRSFTACLAKCQFLVRVCLDKYQTVWNANRQPECPLGSKVAPLPLAQLKKPLVNISFPVLTTWRENFTLILDILHGTGETNPPKLLFRLPSNEVNFTSHHHWKVKSFGSRSPLAYGKPHSQMAPTQRGIGLSVLTTFTFKCSPGFSGPLCENKCDPEDSQLESADCESDETRCPQGYKGQRCDIPICTKGCQNGDCVDPDTCRCHQGWTGEDCSVCQVYPGCKHGSCSFDPKKNRQLPFTCFCEDGWGGMLCDIDLQFCQNNKGVCKNNGKCENVRSPSGQPYRCICLPGFRGDHCEMMQLDCLSHGCRNGGQCTQHMDGQTRCICPKGYYGNLCEFNQTVCSEHPCQAANSVCHPLSRPKNGRQFYCACPPGYTGENCEINVDDCASEPCRNGAFCEDLISSYRCICPSGFSGIWCENREVECPPNTCSKGSTCYKTKDGTFKCSPISETNFQKYQSYSTANTTLLTSAEPLTSDKGSIVMVHLQPSFLSLTIGIPVAVALSGLVLAIAVCLFMAACLWRREKTQSKRKPPPQNFSPKFQLEEDMNGYASETSTVWSAYEPLNSLRSDETTLPKLSLYPKLKGEDKIKHLEPSLYHQQRYCEAPSNRPFSTVLSSTSTYETPCSYEDTSVPTLPPRPSRIGSIIAYPPTFLRPILYPFAPQATFPGQRFTKSPTDLAYTTLTEDNKRHKDTIVYAIIRPSDVVQSLYPNVPKRKQTFIRSSSGSGDGGYRESEVCRPKVLSQLALIETKVVSGHRSSSSSGSSSCREQKVDTSTSTRI